jgi:two-component system OmpR family response regulator
MKVLVADDDPQVREVIVLALERAGFSAITAADGQAALRNARREAPDLLVLDIGLPEIDGLEVCRRLRAETALPILFLTARDDEVDRVIGLEIGADDYLTKPFSPRELIARIKAILRRGRNGAPAPRRHGALIVDPARHFCAVKGAPVALTPTEMALLARLIERPEHVTSRAQLLEALYSGNIHVSDRTLDSHLRNLRGKLARAGCPEAVETVHGVGLRMGPCPEA